MRKAVKAVFTTHTYQFGGRFIHQTSGGPIGLRATGAVARVVIGDWDLKLMRILQENGMETQVAARYVDDIRIMMRALKMGWRWTGKRLEFREDWLEEDSKEGLTRTERTARVLNNIMNSIHTNLRFTMETPENFKDQKLPALDTQVWLEDNKLIYSFYEKPMAAKTVIRRGSALGENIKVASLSQDLVRRMKNTSLVLPTSDRVKVVDAYTSKLMSSGYSRSQTKTIVVAGLKGFEKAVKLHTEGSKKLHRSADEGAAMRNKKKLLEKSNWFKGKKNYEAEIQKMKTGP